jgi:hypothetical protein
MFDPEINPTLNKLYKFLEFDKNIFSTWHTDTCKKTIDQEEPIWFTYVMVGDPKEYNNLKESGFFVSQTQWTNSILMYRKGNHDMFTRVADAYFSHALVKSNKPLGKQNWCVPFKDPIDKLLGGYLSSSHYNDVHSKEVKQFAKTDHYNIIEPILLEVIDATLDGSLQQKHPMFDNHMLPLSLVLENAFQNSNEFDLGKLIGCNLEIKDELLANFYNFILNSYESMPNGFYNMTNARRSPYTHQKSWYIQKIKLKYPHKMYELAHGPLYNEYRLHEFFIHQEYYKHKFRNG